MIIFKGLIIQDIIFSIMMSVTYIVLTNDYNLYS